MAVDKKNDADERQIVAEFVASKILDCMKNTEELVRHSKGEALEAISRAVFYGVGYGIRQANRTKVGLDKPLNDEENDLLKMLEDKYCADGLDKLTDSEFSVAPSIARALIWAKYDDADDSSDQLFIDFWDRFLPKMKEIKKPKTESTYFLSGADNALYSVLKGIDHEMLETEYRDKPLAILKDSVEIAKRTDDQYFENGWSGLSSGARTILNLLLNNRITVKEEIFTELADRALVEYETKFSESYTWQERTLLYLSAYLCTEAASDANTHEMWSLLTSIVHSIDTRRFGRNRGLDHYIYLMSRAALYSKDAPEKEWGEYFDFICQYDDEFSKDRSALMSNLNIFIPNERCHLLNVGRIYPWAKKGASNEKDKQKLILNIWAQYALQNRGHEVFEEIVSYWTNETFKTGPRDAERLTLSGLASVIPSIDANSTAFQEVVAFAERNFTYLIHGTVFETDGIDERNTLLTQVLSSLLFKAEGLATFDVVKIVTEDMRKTMDKNTLHEIDGKILGSLARQADRFCDSDQDMCHKNLTQMGEIIRRHGGLIKVCSPRDIIDIEAILEKLAKKSEELESEVEKFRELNLSFERKVPAFVPSDAQVISASPEQIRKQAEKFMSYSEDSINSWPVPASHVANWKLMLENELLELMPRVEIFEKRIIASLDAAEDGQAPSWSIVGGRKYPADYYPGYDFAEIFLSHDRGKASVCILYSENEIYTFEGKSDIIHQINAKGLLKLTTSDTALSYLRFFCGLVHGEEGAFNLIETKDRFDEYVTSYTSDLEDALGSLELFKPELALSMSHLEKSKDQKSDQAKDERWNGTAIVLYSNALFTSDFSINEAGPIELLDDDPIMAELPVKRLRFQYGLLTLQ